MMKIGIWIERSEAGRGVLRIVLPGYSVNHDLTGQPQTLSVDGERVLVTDDDGVSLADIRIPGLPGMIREAQGIRENLAPTHDGCSTPIMKEAQTKTEAVALVAAALRVPFPLISHEFQVAMDLSRRFDISARDVLEHRAKKSNDDK